MNCRRCRFPFAPHELVDHEGEGKGATGVCLKCLKVERDELRRELGLYEWNRFPRTQTSPVEPT